MLYLGADHRGFKLKEFLKSRLKEWGVEFQDCGAFSYNADDDYNDFALAVAQKVAQNPEGNRGILICGSGIGVDIVANKVKGVKSALVWRKELADHRKYYGENVLALPADFLSNPEAEEIVKIWLNTMKLLQDEKYRRRRQKIEKLEI
ncbi:MAG: RpiB/LacA/LacB family sugar-phosphate isomerase [candidate division WOR-3 bacterium]